MWCDRRGSTTAAGDEFDAARRRYLVGDWAFLTLLAFLVITGFALEGLRIADGEPSFERWSPVGWTLAHGLSAAGMSAATAGSVHHALWWIHGIVALAFVASIPFTKAVHMLAGPVGVTVRSRDAGRRLVPIPGDAEPEMVGYGRIADLSWRHLADLDACTKCGRCHAACPATACGYPLSPRDLVLDLRELAEGSLGIRASVGVQPLHDPADAIVGTVLAPETVWSCMSCMACVEICPVGIEHVPIINQLRRRLVDQGELEPTAADDPRVRPRTGQLARRVRGASAVAGRRISTSRSRTSAGSRRSGCGSSVTRRRSTRETSGSSGCSRRSCVRPESTSASSSTPSAPRATTSAGWARKGCSCRWPSTTWPRSRPASSSAS